jgi:hypothetical protein
MRRWVVLTASLVLAASAVQRAPASAAGSSAVPVFPPGTHLTADFPYGLTQAEPSIKVDDTGKLYVMAPGSTPIGCELWTLPAGGRSFSFHTPPDLGVGGGDCDLALTPPAAGTTAPGVAYSSLSLPDLTVGASSDGGQSFSTPNPVGSDIPMVDRQWNAADGNTVYMSYHLVLSNTIGVARSTDGGRTYTVVGNAVDLDHVAQTLYNNELGPIVVDTHSTASPKPLYTVFVAPSTANANLASAAGTTSATANGVYLAMSLDGGVTWKDTDVYIGDPAVSLDRIFPALAVDAGGGLWIAWSDLSHVYVTHSLTRPKTGGRDSTTTSPTDTSLLGTATSTLDPVLDAALPEAPGATVTWAGPQVVDSGPARANLYPWLPPPGRHGLVRRDRHVHRRPQQPVDRPPGAADRGQQRRPVGRADGGQRPRHPHRRDLHDRRDLLGHLPHAARLLPGGGVPGRPRRDRLGGRLRQPGGGAGLRHRAVRGHLDPDEQGAAQHLLT